MSRKGEPAWHRRLRRQRAADRLLCRVAAAAVSLARHHSSSPPALLRPLLKALQGASHEDFAEGVPPAEVLRCEDAGHGLSAGGESMPGAVATPATGGDSVNTGGPTDDSFSVQATGVKRTGVPIPPVACPAHGSRKAFEQSPAESDARAPGSGDAAIDCVSGSETYDPLSIQKLSLKKYSFVRRAAKAKAVVTGPSSPLFRSEAELAEEHRAHRANPVRFCALCQAELRQQAASLLEGKAKELGGKTATDIAKGLSFNELCQLVNAPWATQAEHG